MRQKLSVLIPWYDDGDDARRSSMNWVFRRYTALFPTAEIVLGNHLGETDEPVFNRSAARNFLAQHSHGDILLFADADVIPQLDALQAGLQALKIESSPWVIPYALGRYYNLSSAFSEAVKQMPCDAPISEPSDSAKWEHKIDSWAGMILVPRDRFDKVGGYDEAFIGWGYEDNAFRSALDRTVGHHTRVDSYALHLWHPAPEAECFGQPEIASNRARYQQYEAGEL